MDDQGWAEALVKLLEGQFTVAGVLLVGFVVFIISLNQNWIVTGPRYKDCTKTCDNCDSTLATARAELKRCESDYTNARITIVRHEEREFFSRQWQPQPPSYPPGTSPPSPEGGS